MRAIAEARGSSGGLAGTKIVRRLATGPSQTPGSALAATRAPSDPGAHICGSVYQYAYPRLWAKAGEATGEAPHRMLYRSKFRREVQGNENWLGAGLLRGAASEVQVYPGIGCAQAYDRRQVPV